MFLKEHSRRYVKIQNCIAKREPGNTSRSESCICVLHRRKVDQSHASPRHRFVSAPDFRMLGTPNTHCVTIGSLASISHLRPAYGDDNVSFRSTFRELGMPLSTATYQRKVLQSAT